MPATVITSSPNVASLDSRIIADLCAGQFIVSLAPTIWIGSGASNVLGAKIQITNPFGVVTRAYPTSYDVTPILSGGMIAPVSISVPTQANNYQYGNYIIAVQLTDANGTNYIVSKTVSICAPDELNKTRNYGTLSAKLSGICSEGKVYVLVDNEPTYKGIISGSSVRNFTLDYPTGSGSAPFVTPQPSFSVQLFEGVYKIVGTSCALYDYGDNISVKINYKVNFSKSILCSLDECCVFTGLDALNTKLNSDCTDLEKKETTDRIQRAALLIDTIQSGSSCGEDVSDYILQLEDALGLTCSCNFNNGTPIINNNPTEDFIIQGCNVTSEVAGLTTTYTINAYTYEASVIDNGGALVATDVVVNGCVQSQSFTFNIGIVYDQILNIANTDYDSWAHVIKTSLNSIDASCIGLTSMQLAALDLNDFVQLIINKACVGGNCPSTVDSISATQHGADVIFGWTETNANTIDIFIDGILKATVLGTVSSYTASGFADGLTHTYEIESKCANGIYGTAMAGTFGFTGCAVIAPPILSSTNVSMASCPFDLTGLVSSLPTGIVAQWHTANNTSPSTLLGDPIHVSDGVYYVFATDSGGCYSTAVAVTVTCAVSSSCTAPQNLTLTAVIGGVKAAFQTPTYPPPANSYTVKRKPAASPDVDGSYTTIGTPVFNVSTSRWEIIDTTATANTLYTYKAISNCGGTTPSVLVNFANITCPSVTLTSPTTSSIGYSFTPIGGSIDKYTVEIRDTTGVTLIHTDTFLPSLVFPNPITGTFFYLSEGVNYKIRVIPFIGTDSFPCTFYDKFTTSPLSADAGRSGAYSGTLSSSVSGGIAPYSYLWTVVASGGLCESHTITSPTASSTNYSCTAYVGVTYVFSLRVTDSLGTIVNADTLPTATCLVPETLILMADGTEKPLAEIKEGDEVSYWNSYLNKKSTTKVISKTYHTVDKLYVINGGLLKTSAGHFNVVRNDNYDTVQSMYLKQGEVFIDINGGDVIVDNIEILDGDFEVINISTVSKLYIANGVSTHNKIACP